MEAEWTCRSDLPQYSLTRSVKTRSSLIFMAVEERQHAVVEEIGGRDRRLAIVQLREADLGEIAGRKRYPL